MTSSKHIALFCSIHALLGLVLIAGCGDDDGGDGQEGSEDGGAHHAGTGGGGGGGGGHAGTGGSHEGGSGGSVAEDAAAPSGIEVAGEWSSMYGDESIDDAMWSGSTIVRFDNAKNEAITQGPATEDDAGVEMEGTFSKLVWTEIDGDAFYYCYVAFLQPTAAEADANAMPADDSDPDNGGCGDSGFPWTKLERK